MHERHENEQYFFDDATVDHLARFISRFSAPCCICAPTVGKRLAETNVDVTVLDIDKRFKEVTGFQVYDLYKPTWLEKKFDIIICDPPFFNVSLSQLFRALRMLAHHDFSQPMLISHLSRRSNAIEGTFAPFQLKATGYCPGYQTVKNCDRNAIEFFGNLPSESTAMLQIPGEDD